MSMLFYAAGTMHGLFMQRDRILQLERKRSSRIFQSHSMFLSLLFLEGIAFFLSSVCPSHKHFSPPKQCLDCWGWGGVASLWGSLFTNSSNYVTSPAVRTKKHSSLTVRLVKVSFHIRKPKAIFQS